MALYDSKSERKDGTSRCRGPGVCRAKQGTRNYLHQLMIHMAENCPDLRYERNLNLADDHKEKMRLEEQWREAGSEISAKKTGCGGPMS